VHKTTVYLPDDLRAAVKRLARIRGVSEAELIREAVRARVADNRPRPQGGLFAGEAPVADRADEFLAGFGER
jgi:hypothetical protein